MLELAFRIFSNLKNDRGQAASRPFTQVMGRWRDAEREDPNVGRSNKDERKSPVLPRSRFRAWDSDEGFCSFAHRNGIAQGITVIP